MKLLCDIIGSLILSIATIYLISRIMNLSIKNIGIIRYMFSILVLSIYLIISYYSTMMFLRYLLVVFVITLILVIICRQPIKDSFISSFFSFIIVVISEFIFAIIVVGLFKINLDNFHGIIASNVGIALIMSAIISFPKICDFVRTAVKKLTVSQKYYVITLTIAFCLSVSIIVYINYFSVSSSVRFILSLVIIVVYTIITIILFNEKSNNSKIQYEYEMILKNLNDYEKMLEFQKVANHENKNQLLVIKGMIKKGDNNLNEYIDGIVSEKREDNEDFLYKTNIIPSGGLRGLVYYKTLSMKENNVDVLLKISSKIRKLKLEQMGINLNKDLCKIMGIILDNAMQAVENLSSKNIDIEMDCDPKTLIIMVSNNFEGELNLSEMDNMGYTTKGSGHGYGLTLMKQLIDKNPLLSNQKYIYGQKFVQKITLNLE